MIWLNITSYVVKLLHYPQLEALTTYASAQCDGGYKHWAFASKGNIVKNIKHWALPSKANLVKNNGKCNIHTYIIYNDNKKGAFKCT